MNNAKSGTLLKTLEEASDNIRSHGISVLSEEAKFNSSKETLDDYLIRRLIHLKELQGDFIRKYEPFAVFEGILQQNPINASNPFKYRKEKKLLKDAKRSMERLNEVVMENEEEIAQRARNEGRRSAEEEVAAIRRKYATGGKRKTHRKKRSSKKTRKHQSK
jgi:hypothetical protein